MNKKTILATALLALFTCAASEAKADTVWTLSNVELSDNTYLNGSFSINQYGWFDSFNLTTMVGGLSGYTYSSAGSSPSSINNPTDTVVTFSTSNYEGYLTLTFQHSLSNAAATDSIVGGSTGPSYECYGWGCPPYGTSDPTRYVVANQSASLLTPLPAAIWLAGSALAGLLGYGARRRVAA